MEYRGPGIRGAAGAISVTELIASVKPYTKSGFKRLEAMAAAVRKIDNDNIPGDIVECGVWRGGNIILARKVSPQRTCWLYDTFNGMTEPGPLDVKQCGFHASVSFETKAADGKAWAKASLDEVRKGLADTGTLDDSKLRFVEGPVEQTLLDPANLPDQIALLRLDTDWYASTRMELEALYPRLSPGGILIVDDYGHWVGARRAVHEYFGADHPVYNWIDYTAISLVKPLTSNSADADECPRHVMGNV